MQVQYDCGLDWNLPQATFSTLLTAKQRQYVDAFIEHHIPETEHVYDVIVSLSSNKKQLTFLLHKIYGATETMPRSASETLFQLSAGIATLSKETYVYADNGNPSDQHTTVLYRNPLRWPSSKDFRMLLLRYMG